MTSADIGFFGRLSPEHRRMVERAADRRLYRPGDILCRRGDRGHACLVIVSGGVHVQVALPSDGPVRSVFLGPGQLVGEMSLLSGSPITATVVAAVDTEALAIPRRTFLTLVNRDPGLRDALFKLLIERMRHRESLASRDESIPCAVLVVTPESDASAALCAALFRGVEYYAPGSVFVDATGRDGGGILAGSELPPMVPPSPTVTLRSPSNGGPAVVAGGGHDWCARLIDNWRTGGGVGHTLCLVISQSMLPALAARLRPDDLVLLLLGGDRGEGRAPQVGGGLAAIDRVYLGTTPVAPYARWAFRVPESEVVLARRSTDGGWDRNRWPTLDWLARRLTGREVGIALGAGAAAGLAHLGVLEVLDETGIPVDYLCGSSMGGVVALTYAKVASARLTTQMVRGAVGSNEKIRDITWFPRSALLRGAKRREAARVAMGDTTFAEFEKPAAVVAADLARGARVVLDEGSGRLAMLATSAIPGIFPPESRGEHVFVDGGLVSRIPVDLLDRRRCGLKIAVNVVPSPVEADDDPALLRADFDRYLGLTGVIASAWGLLAWWHGAAEAGPANVLIEPQRGRHSGYDFGQIDAMIAAGRAATTAKLDLIRDSVSSLLRPGAP